MPSHPDLVGILGFAVVLCPILLAGMLEAVGQLVAFARRRRARQRGFPVDLRTNEPK